VEGLQNVDAIARASDRLEAVIFGAGDFSASQGARVDTNFDPVASYPGDMWHYARARIVVAARAAGIDAIDAPFPNYRNPGAYRVACDRASAMGYAGSPLHPPRFCTPRRWWPHTARLRPPAGVRPDSTVCSSTPPICVMRTLSPVKLNYLASPGGNPKVFADDGRRVGRGILVPTCGSIPDTSRLVAQSSTQRSIPDDPQSV